MTRPETCSIFHRGSLVEPAALPLATETGLHKNVRPDMVKLGVGREFRPQVNRARGLAMRNRRTGPAIEEQLPALHREGRPTPRAAEVGETTRGCIRP